jgi:hypothetical protein
METIMPLPHQVMNMIRNLFNRYTQYLGLTLLLLLQVRAVKAQNWPTQVNTIIIAPYSPFTGDYVNTPGKMIVNLLLRDINASNVKVKLRINIEGQGTGIRLTTSPQANTPILTLDGGMPLRLSDADLAPYFRPENLLYTGITAAEYSNGGKLPEDLYKICFEAYELFTGARISVSNGCGNAWIILNDPPFLNTPTNAVKVPVRAPGIVTFQWTPRHKGSPNAAFATAYLFQLVELMPGFDNNPQAAFLSSLPLYETTTSSTMLVYGMMGEVPLEPGRKYAWRIKAKSLAGAQEMDLFKNQGFSEIFVFTYAGDCAIPLNVTAKAKGSTRIQLDWKSGGANQSAFVASYRKAGVPDAAWFDEKTTATTLTINDLAPGVTYEYRIRSDCGAEGESAFTTVDTVSTLTETPVDYTCGTISAEESITNMEPLPQLVARDEITAGRFKVKLTKVSGANGSYSGKGYITVPYLHSSRLEVNFNNILVNTDYQLAKGVIETAYDPKWEGINDLDNYFEGGGNTGKVVTGNEAVDIVVDVSIPGPENIQVTLPVSSGGTTTTTPTATTITITGGNNATVTKTVDQLPVSIKDKDGNIYKVDEKGAVTQVAKGGGSALLPPAAERNQLHTGKAVVTFTGHPDQVYAFDAWKDDYLRSSLFSARYEALSDNYRVSSKAIAAGQTDVVRAKIAITDNNAIQADKVQFVTSAGANFVSKLVDANTYDITIQGGPANDAQELYAVYKMASGEKISLGKLLISAYEMKQRKVVLVPVNGAPVDKASIITTLKRIYGPVCVNWDVLVDDVLPDNSWDLDGDQLLDVGSGGLLGSGTREMKRLQEIYAARREIEDKAVYLFILRNGKNKDNLLAGDMPRAQQFGYLFTDGAKDIGKTAAHELAHGVFHLKHSFDGYGLGQNDLPENLMNYRDGELLTKFQWDALHDPGVVWGVFESEGDGAEAAAVPAEGITLADNQYFVTLDGYVIQLPKGAVILPSCDDDYKKTFTDIGALLRFKDQGQVWEHKIISNPGGGEFYGYKNEAGQLYKPTLKATTPQKQLCKITQSKDKAGKLTLTINKVELKDAIPVLPANYEQLLSASDGNDIEEVFINETQLSSVATAVVKPCTTPPPSTPTPTADQPKDALKTSLTDMAGRLNHKWDVVIDNGDGHPLSVSNGTGSKGKVTYKFRDGKWDVDITLYEDRIKKSRHYKEGDLDKTKKIIEEAIRQKLAKFAPGKNGTTLKDGKEVIPVTTVESVTTEDGGEFNFGKGVNWAQWGMVLIDAGVEIYEEAALPKTYWKQDEAKYGGYPVHGPPTFCGLGDGVIDEVTAVPQLVKLGIEVVTDKEKALAIWNSVKKINISSIKKVAVGAIRDKWDKYANGPSYIGFHEAGKDGVQVLTMATGGFVPYGKGDVTDAVRETGEEIGRRAARQIDWGLVKRYFKHIEDMTGRPVHPSQIERLKDALRAKNYERMTAAQVEAHRNAFESIKDRVIRDWERETGQVWPTYTEDLPGKGGKILRKAGDKYDAHHIIENKVGGDHEWWNMHPAKFPDEHQGGIHGAGSPSRELFP